MRSARRQRPSPSCVLSTSRRTSDSFPRTTSSRPLRKSEWVASPSRRTGNLATPNRWNVVIVQSVEEPEALQGAAMFAVRATISTKMSTWRKTLWARTGRRPRSHTQTAWPAKTVRSLRAIRSLRTTNALIHRPSSRLARQSTSTDSSTNTLSHPTTVQSSKWTKTTRMPVVTNL